MKSNREVKNIGLFIKVNKSELDKIKEHAKAKGVKVSAYVRSKALGKKIKVKVL